MNRSTPGLPVHHQLPEFTQTHVHRVGDATAFLGLQQPYKLFPVLFSFRAQQLLSLGINFVKFL